jgi:DNA helicase-2/ATP-dependent DNA helicase PcrA
LSAAGIRLNPAQRAAVEHLGTPLLVLAGAGSGKTRVLTAKIAFLLGEVGLLPHRILAVTFTNKAAGEMLGRVRQLVGEAAAGLFAGTFHSYCARLLRRHAERIGFRPGFSIYDEADQRALLRRLLADSGLSEQTFTPGGIAARIGRAKAEMVPPEDAAWFGSGWVAEQVARLYAGYQERLRALNAMDFDDLLVHAVHLLQEHDDLRERYAERYLYVLVDEYQDTNRPQYELVRMLAARHRGLCVVGDPDQSIYAWRGADIRNILSFERDWSDVRVVVLDQNYRSTQNILSAASGLINHNPGRPPKNLWSERGEGEPVCELVFVDDDQEARGITRIIGAKRSREGRPLGDFVLLYRTNAQSRVLERALRGAGLPYTVVGGLRFYERAEIKDALAWLRCLVNPRDTVSLARALARPRRGVGGVTLGRLFAFLDGWTGEADAGLPAAVEGLGRGAGGVRSFAALLGRFRGRVGDHDISGLTHDLLEEAGYFEMLRVEGGIEAQTRRENLEELLAGMEEFSSEWGDEADLVLFLEEISLLTDVDTWERSGESVTLMTLHAAKGLEFPVVFITGLEEGLFPLERAQDDPGLLEEERRLCYVGMTRAQQELYLTRARVRRRWGNLEENLSSRFLGEIPPGRLKVVDQLGPGRRVSGGRPGPLRAETDPFPDYEGENQDAGTGLRTGQTVEHPTLGRGRILSVTGQGERTRLVVAFEETGTRKLMARYARLRIVR